MNRRAALALIGVGLAAGGAAGLLGIGGGVLIVPALVLLYSYDQRTAQGTSLAAMTAIALAGVLTYAHHSTSVEPMMDWRFAAFLAIGGVSGALVGGSVVRLVHLRVLRYVFCTLLVLVGIRMILGGCGIGESAGDAPVAGARSASEAAWLVCIGLAAGFVGSMLGIAAGLLAVPALVLLMCVPQKLAQGSSLAATAVTAAAGALLYARRREVTFRAAGWIGLGGAAGAIAGSTAAAHLETTTLRIVFGACLIAISTILALNKDKS